jgi:predicted Ser/Thr protein kinase
MGEPRYKLLKKDVFGRVSLCDDGGSLSIVRDALAARPWIRWLARGLLAREARALAAAHGTAGIPEVLRAEIYTLHRSFIAGEPMQRSRPTDIDYFRAAARLLRRLHVRGIVHNDLAKEPNWLVTDEGEPGIVDFQLAWYAPKRGRLFRLLAHEDIRHLLKHKRTYCPDHLTRRELAILDNPTIISRIWMFGGKPLYLFVTRKIFGWADREGAEDRSALG